MDIDYWALFRMAKSLLISSGLIDELLIKVVAVPPPVVAGDVAAEDVVVMVAIPFKLWVRLCRRKSQFRRKTFPQDAQWYGLMSVWVSKCVFKLDLWLKLRLQTGHLCGDSSMCRILWTARVRDWQNPLPHSRHLKGFSFEWMYLGGIRIEKKTEVFWLTIEIIRIQFTQVGKINFINFFLSL